MTGSAHPARLGTAVTLAALLIGAAAPTPARAYALEGQIWANRQTNFSYVVPGANSGAFTAALFQALVDWNQTSAFKYKGVRQSADPCASSGRNGAGFGAKACGQAFGSGVLAVTFTTFTSSNRFVHAGTVFNSNVNFSVYGGALKPNATDFRRVAVHEMGHALGMAHENNPNIPAIMAPFVSNIQKPTADDIAGVRAMYGR
jgi:predicted Zn-dependent protease